MQFPAPALKCRALTHRLSPRMPALRLHLLVCLMLLPLVSIAGDSERGRELAWQYRCMTCHGVEGRTKDPRYPRLAGQQPLYIIDRLEYFQAEIEPFNEMNGHARPLTAEMKRDLAAYFSEQRL